MRESVILSIISTIFASSLFLALTAFYSVKGNPVIVFLSSFLTWNSYLISHKMATGNFIHDERDVGDEGLPNEVVERLKIVLSSLVLVIGILLGVYALRKMVFSLTYFASIVFWLGYILTHYFVTDEIL